MTLKTIRLAAAGLALWAATGVAEPAKVIFDTDMYTDFDDVGALALLHTLADDGECEILGTVTSTRSAAAVAMVEIVNAYYGRSELPVGAPKGCGIGPDCDPDAIKCAAFRIYADYVRNRAEVRHPTLESVPDANDVYRRLLAAAPDRSVTVVTVGFTTNMRRLLESKGDVHSSLDGRSLVARKVKAWYAMACRYPDGFEYNSGTDAQASRIAFRDWPTDVYFLDFNYGVSVRCGVPVSKCAESFNPVRDIFKRALEDYREVDKGHPAWDELTVLAAVRGTAGCWNVERGTFSIVEGANVPKGTNHWQADVNGRHLVLKEKTPRAEVGRVVDELMARAPRLRRR